MRAKTVTKNPYLYMTAAKRLGAVIDVIDSYSGQIRLVKIWADCLLFAANNIV